MGKFTQVDPAGITDEVNLYGFTEGDLVNYADPFGLCDTGKAWCQFWNNFVQGIRVVSSPNHGACDGPGCKTGTFAGLFTMAAPTARAPLGRGGGSGRGGRSIDPDDCWPPRV